MAIVISDLSRALYNSFTYWKIAEPVLSEKCAESPNFGCRRGSRDVSRAVRPVRNLPNGGVGGGGSQCLLSILRNGYVACPFPIFLLSILRNVHVTCPYNYQP